MGGQLDPAGDDAATRPPLPPAPVGTPAGLFVEVSDSLDDLVAGFGAPEWHAAALVGWTVRDVLAHLTAVHEVLAGRLEGAESGPVTVPELHRANERVIDELRLGGIDATHRRWRAGVGRVRLAVAGAEAAIVPWLGLEPPAVAVLVDRAFETWIHADDIRRAVGLPGVDPSDPHLRILCDLAAQLLPVALQRTGRAHDAVVTLDLTGPGGGIWTVPLGAGAAGGRAVRITAPARELCLVMGDRLDPTELTWVADGDPGAAAVARDLALAAPVFARA